MPTILPSRFQHAAAARCLSWPELARFAVLLLRVRWLSRRLTAAYRRVERAGVDAGGPGLLLTARRWVEAHDAVNALLGTPELPEVGQVRAMMRRPTDPTDRSP